MVILAAIGILATIILANVKNARESANIARAVSIQDALKQAVLLYEADMGFYPPDVNRGWDPGFTQQNPSNPDFGTFDPPTRSYTVPGTNCGHCPSNWLTLLAQRWDGPYISEWPRHTPWNGKYDYNYWGSGAVRFGCPVPPGVYVGIQGNYTNNNQINTTAEQKMVGKGYDGDNCVNGESQLKMKAL